MFHAAAGCLFWQFHNTFIIAYPHPFQAISNPASHLPILTSPQTLFSETLVQGLISRVRGRFRRLWKARRLGLMKLEGLSRSRGLQKMAYDRTAGLRIRNLCHFLERCKAGWKETGIHNSRADLYGMMQFFFEICKNEALEQSYLIFFFTHNFCLNLVAEPLMCKPWEEQPATISAPTGCNRGLVIISNGYRSAMKAMSYILTHAPNYLPLFIHTRPSIEMSERATKLNLRFSMNYCLPGSPVGRSLKAWRQSRRGALAGRWAESGWGSKPWRWHNPCWPCECWCLRRLETWRQKALGTSISSLRRGWSCGQSWWGCW